MAEAYARRRRPEVLGPIGGDAGRGAVLDAPSHAHPAYRPGVPLVAAVGGRRPR